MKHFISLLAVLFVWVSQGFYNIDSALKFLNTLPPESGGYIIGCDGLTGAYFRVIYKK